MATLTDMRLYGPEGACLDPATWAPNGVRGADKVVARYTYALLTAQGSIPGRPADGSPFVEMAAGFRSEFDVFAAFVAADPAASSTVRAAELPDEPDSEKLGSVTLTSVTIVGGLVMMTLSISSRDGSIPSSTSDIVASL